eukprot:COSAG01_NODE_64122_length_277_cov_1.691011_1_plen_82_part_10
MSSPNLKLQAENIEQKAQLSASGIERRKLEEKVKQMEQERAEAEMRQQQQKEAELQDAIKRATGEQKKILEGQLEKQQQLVG